MLIAFTSLSGAPRPTNMPSRDSSPKRSSNLPRPSSAMLATIEMVTALIATNP